MPSEKARHTIPNLGLIELRRAICGYVAQHLWAWVTSRRNEVLDHGRRLLSLDLVLRALIDPGDKVMYHQPCYVSYHPSVTLTHGIAGRCPTTRRTSLR